MSLGEGEILGYARVLTLILGLGWAAKMDWDERRVANQHWMVWVKPAVFIWALDLMTHGADWTIFLTAAGVVAYASIAVIGRPTLRDILAGSKIDIIVSLWYLAGIVGMVCGAILYQEVNPLDVLLGNEVGLGALWWKTFAVIIPIFIVDMAWRLRLIHGGADSKCLMWLAILMPDWSTLPLMTTATGDALVALPPAIAILMWGGFIFLLILPILFFTNLKNVSFKSFGDFKMAWYSGFIPISQVKDKHVWLLTYLMEMPDGERVARNKTRAPKRSPSDEELSAAITELEEFGLEKVWVSYKFPLLVFLFIGLFPTVLLGDPMVLIMPLLPL